VSQHIEYVPFGEVFIEERNNTWNTPYLFNAKEFDEETGMYYYGARYYEPRLSLWMSADPKQDKYPNVSSYCYVMDNPIKLIDPDGKDVLIWYKDKHGRDQLFRFSGFHGKKSIKIPNNQYVKDFIQAYLYNAKHGGGKKTIQAVSNHKYEIYVSDSQNDETYYSGGDRQPTVYWESRQGLKTTEGGKQSAATALEHEMDHAVDDANNHKQHVERRQMGDSNYDNKEERRVITGSEAQTAKGNKEAVRRNHRGTSYRTASPTSTTPSK
ncbi:RHS repeat-associated core domain-containing protein, partial [Prevotella disiens]